MLDGVSVLNENLLIPFKTKAHLDLSKRKAEGQKIGKKDVNKHRNDVFRLAQLLPEDRSVELPQSIRDDLLEFLDAVANDDDFDPRNFGVDLTRDEGIALLRAVYDS